MKTEVEEEGGGWGLASKVALAWRLAGRQPACGRWWVIAFAALPSPSSPSPSVIPELWQVLKLIQATWKQGWVAASEQSIQIDSLELSEVPDLSHLYLMGCYRQGMTNTTLWCCKSISVVLQALSLFQEAVVLVGVSNSRFTHENLFLFDVENLRNWPVISRHWPGNGPVVNVFGAIFLAQEFSKFTILHEFS